MPCSGPEPTRADWEETLRHNSDLADMLCAVMKELERRNIQLEVGEELAIWWKEHKRRDAKKRLEEQEAARATQVRDAALKKLTPKERKALGF